MPSYPLTMPTNVGIKASEFGLVRSVGLTVSPFTGQQQTYINSFALWRAVYNLPLMNRQRASEWMSFLSELNGRYGTFLAGDQDCKTIQGVASGTILVNGEHSIGATSIAMDGFALSTNNVFKKGDYLQFGSGSSSKLHIVTANANSNASGQSTIEIQPPLKTALSDNSSVTYTNTKAVFRLDENNVNWQANETGLFSISFSCTESI